jgi:pantoate kinase
VKLDQDKLNNASVVNTARATYAMLNAVAKRPAHERVMAGAAQFLTLLEVYGLDPQEVMTKAKNLMNHAEGRRAEFLALKLFAENEA